MKFVYYICCIIVIFLVVQSTCDTNHTFYWVGGTKEPTKGNNVTIPPSLFSAFTWIDASGNLWMYGGWNGVTVMDDMWKYVPDTNTWYHIAGNLTGGISGVYPDTTGQVGWPGSLCNGASWTDKTKTNLWLFGGDPSGYGNSLNFLSNTWMFSTVTLQWTFSSGQKAVPRNANPLPSLYQTGTPSARVYPAYTTDPDGNFWMFGGYGYFNPQTTAGYLGDVWMKNGNQNSIDWYFYYSSGYNYAGTTNLIVGVAGNPSSRSQASLWFFNGLLYMYGGYTPFGNPAKVNCDTWNFNVTANASIKWMIKQVGNTACDPVYSGINPSPGRRIGTSYWTLGSELYMFSGTMGTSGSSIGTLDGNEMWLYDANASIWGFIGGTTTANDVGVYNSISTSGTPAARSYSNYWKVNNDLWFYGGADWNNVSSPYADLWKFSVCATGWTGYNCDTAICKTGCVNGGCTNDPGKCKCFSGYSGDLCNIPVCSKGCVNGNCISPDVCQCSSGWAGDSCSTCAAGRYGPYCNITCDATINCNGRGQCNSDGQCQCNAGYTDSTCNTCNSTYFCGAHGTCNLDGTCKCTDGYTGNACQQKPCYNCTYNNGGCSYYTTCTANCDITCGACPLGTSGNGTVCNKLCGDGVCNSAFEDCVTCPQDCSVPCSKCGDSFCDSTIGETCSTCYDDCGPCEVEQCPESCNGHGDCSNGQCICKPLWSGPSCNVGKNEAINVVANVTVPNIRIESTNNSVFFVDIGKILEYNSTGDVVRQIDMSNLTFTLVLQMNGTNKIYTYSASMQNGGTIRIVMQQLGDNAQFKFAGTTTNYLPNSLKFAVTIANYPFFSLTNYLGIVFDSPQSQKICTNTKLDESNSLVWFLTQVGELSFYGQYLDKAILDGSVRSIFYKYDGVSAVTAIIPHFWDYAEIDPGYSVIQSISEEEASNCSDKQTGGDSDDKTKKKDDNVKIILPVVLTIGIVAIAAGVGFFAFRQVKQGKWKVPKRVKAFKTISQQDVRLETK